MISHRRPRAAVAPKGRHPIAQGTALGSGFPSRPRRSGYSLVEMLVVMSVNSALMGVAVTLLAMLVKGDRGGRQHCEQTRALVELAEQFRNDVAAASDATLVADKTGGTLRLQLSRERSIDYARDGDRIRRLESEGSSASRREAYSLPNLASATFDIDGDKFATLNLTFSGDDNAFRIDARLAKDRRFAREESNP